MLTVLGCPEVLAPNGSYVSNGTLTLRTFLCKSGSVFPDSMERKRTLECKNGKWNETINKLPGCVGKNLPNKSIMLYFILYFYSFARHVLYISFIGHSVILPDESMYFILYMYLYITL